MEWLKNMKIRARMNLVISASAVILVFTLAFVAYLFESSRIKKNVDFRAYQYLESLSSVANEIVIKSDWNDASSQKKLLELTSNKIFIGSAYFLFVSTENGIIITPNKETEKDDFQNIKDILKVDEQKGKTKYYNNEPLASEGILLFYQKLSPKIGGYVISKVYVKEAYVEIRKMIATMLWFSPVVFILYFLVILWFSGTLINPLKRCVVFIKQLSEGNLNVSVNISSKDEVGLLSQSFNNLSLKLREVIAGIDTGAQEVAASSQEISENSQHIAAGANEQAATVEELASSIEEISASIDQVSSGASKASQITLEASEKLKRIGDTSAQSNRDVARIAEKIRIITDIAFQTNILALNAAVEAARAGEHGKGFSVVATEVRKLAERSKIAAEEISTLATKTVKATSLSNSLLQKMIPEVRETMSLIEKVSNLSSEQLQQMDQVNIAVQELNEVSQQNSVAAEELATGSEELNEQAHHFVDSISFFKY